ncbi:MAG: DUF5394 family protein [Alphaproteobacteria bacterium]
MIDIANVPHVLFFKPIIENLKKSQHTDFDLDIIALLQELLGAFSQNLDNFPSYDSLSSTQQKLLLEELKKIISALSELGLSQEESLEYIINNFLKSFNNLSKNHRKEKDNFTLTERDRKRIQEELERIAIYEEYKALNPNRIAGETKLDNFIHNMKIGGMKRASKYEGGKEKDLKGYSADLIKELEQAYKENKNKGGRGR